MPPKLSLGSLTKNNQIFIVQMPDLHKKLIKTEKLVATKVIFPFYLVLC